MQLRRTRLATAVALAMWGTASAQEMMHIYVTGSNIRRTDTETASPLETITREDIQASGLQTISDVLRQITANNNGSISPSFTNGTSVSGSAVSLRGLGPNNTLVLLNGRRLANFGLADDLHASYVDLQQIPFDAVERIEVLKDGASAIYGSDAVAGVVNVILRQTYTGVTATATAGTLYNGAGNQIKGALTMGAGDLTNDRYNVFLTVDGHKQDAIPANRGRQYAGTTDYRFMGLPDSRRGIPSLGSRSGLLGNVFAVSAAKPDGPTLGPLTSLPGYCAPKDQVGPYCAWDIKDYTDLLPSIERYNVFARGTYNASDSLQAYAEASYFHVKTDIRGAPPSVTGTWSDPATGDAITTRTLYLPVGHPDNPFSANNQVARLSYIDGALGGAHNAYNTGTQRYLAGMKGIATDWYWDVAALYIRSDTDIALSHNYSYDRLLQGIAGTGPYGYYRVGASAAQNDPAVYDWIAPSRAYSTLSENSIVDAKASRDMYQLQGGQLALAVGYEFLREELHNPGVPGTATGNVVGRGYNTVAGSRTVNALYAELFAPILGNLEVTAAVRYDNYSDFGSTTNPKIGVKWTVVPQLVLRGTWQTAFRAPGLYEAGLTTNAGVISFQDPVRCPLTNVGCSGMASAELAGNPSLHPETSTTYTAGFIWEPIRGLNAIVDYWNIRTKGQITMPDFQAIIENPPAFPGLRVVRDTNDLPGIPNSGTILFVGNQWQNANVVETDGVDLDVVWRQSLGQWGTLRTELQWTHIFNFNQSFPNSATYHFVGTQGPVSVSSGAGTLQDRANLILGWGSGPLTVTGTVRYVSGLESIAWRGAKQTQGCLAPLLDGPDCHVASFTTLDLSASYSGFKNWQVFGSVINVFNRLAPFNPAFGGVNYNWAYSGATGTQFNLGARYTFQ